MIVFDVLVPSKKIFIEFYLIYIFSEIRKKCDEFLLKLSCKKIHCHGLLILWKENNQSFQKCSICNFIYEKIF